MNRNDIIRMALKAGFLDRKESCPLSGDSRFDEEICVGEYPVGEIVERFATLVSAHEREACAYECEVRDGTFALKNAGKFFADIIRARFADIIRTRGEQEQTR